MSKLQEKRDQSTKLIIHTALRLFSELGYEGTSIRNISKEAGISLGLMYNYFESKDELLLEILKYGKEVMRESFLKLAEEPTNQTPIEQYVRHTVRFLKEKKELWKLLHTIPLQSPEVQQLQTDIRNQSEAAAENVRQYLIDSGIPFPELEAKLLLASVDGMVHHFITYNNYPIDDVATLLLMKYKR